MNCLTLLIINVGVFHVPLKTVSQNDYDQLTFSLSLPLCASYSFTVYGTVCVSIVSLMISLFID